MSETFCLPVVPQNERFVAARRVAVYEMPRFDVLQTYLEQHYSKLPDSRVEIEGIVYRTTVFVPVEADDSSYALVGNSGVPDSDQGSINSIRTLLTRYWLRVRSHLQFGDSLSAMYRTYITDEFIPPRFTVFQPRESSAADTLTWPELREHARLVLVGPPGSGKTTCLRMLAISAATDRRSQENPRVPVYIAMRSVREGEFLLDRAAHELDLEPASHGFLDLVSSGRITLILDGLDEVEDRLGDAVIGQVMKISREYPDMGLAISTREGGYHWRFPSFFHARIAPFSQMERDEWIRRRIGRTNKAVAARFIRLLTATPKLDAETATPLFLSLAATIFEGSGLAPSSISDLVLRYVDALVDKWDAERGVMRWKYRPYDGTSTMRILCRTAFSSKAEEKIGFTERTLSEWEAEWADKVDATEFLTYVWKGSSLVEPSPDRKSWQFQSSIIRDVLCAKYLVECTDDLIKASGGTLSERDILSVWQHACEISQDASPLLEAVFRSSISPEWRAVFIASVLVEDISVRADTQKEALQFISSTLTDMAERLTTLESNQSPLDWRLEVSAKNSSDNPLLPQWADILRSLMVRGTPQRRLILAKSLMDADNWLLTHICPQIIEEPERAPANVKLGVNTIIIEADPD